MKLLFLLSGEHPLLPREEIIGVLEGENIEYRIMHEGQRLLILDLDSSGREFLQRLALTRKAGEFLGKATGVKEIAGKISGRISAGSFAVRSKSKKLEERLGKELTGKGLRVDLEDPEYEILLFQDQGMFFSAINMPLERDFSSRKPQYRPFFHPTSMDPKLARALVNLSRVKPGNRLLDPFCGTGGILIEGGLMGMSLKGIDISEEMVQGCRKNLEYYGLEGDISQGDALQAKLEKVDAICTDPPYGRGSFVTVKKPEEFYQRFISSAGNSLEEGGFLTLVTPAGISFKTRGFDPIKRFDVYIHKSLTRRIHVLKRASF